MSLQIKGKVIGIEDLESFTSVNGTIFQKQLILEVTEKFPNDKSVVKTIPLVRKAKDESPKMYCKVGDMVMVSFSIESRQAANGRWYTNLICKMVEKIGG